jgi:16S rRNA processing protein RimM
MLKLLNPGCVVYIGDAHQPYTVEKTRWKKPLLLLKFNGISDRTAASLLTNQLVFINASQLDSLPEGEFYYHELIGLDVYDEDDQSLGVLEEVLETGANDVYVIRDKNKKETLIPAINDMILSVEPERGVMIVSRMEWYGEERYD